MKNKIILLLVSLLISFSLASCYYPMKNDSQETNIETNLDDVNNDYGNYIPIGEMLYFTHPNDERKLYRMKFDGSNIEKIDLSKDIYKLGWLSSDLNYLYGVSSGKLYKISLINPSQVQILRDSGVYSPILHNNKIYYLDFLKKFNLFRVETDASNMELLIDDLVASPMIHKSWIFYRNEKDNHTLYRIELDGSNKTKMNNVRTWNPVFYNNEVFFMNNTDYGKLYRMNLEKLTIEKLSEEKFIKPIFVSNSWLYLIQQDIGANKLLKLKLDSKDTKTFVSVFNSNSEYIENVYLRNTFLIFETIPFAETINNPLEKVIPNNNFTVYRMSLDGTIVEKLIP